MVRLPDLKLRETLFLDYDDEGEPVWEKPRNLHDKIVYFVHRKSFTECLAKIRLEHGKVYRASPTWKRTMARNLKNSTFLDGS